MFATIGTKAQQWSGGSTSSSGIYRAGNVTIGASTTDYRLRLQNGQVQMLLGYGGADPYGVGDHLFRLFNSQGQLFTISSYGTLQNKLIADIGTNYSINGTNGTVQYATNGAKKAPYIRLNAEDGSISLYGENGTGSNYRGLASNLGVYVKRTGAVGIGTYNIPADGRLAVEGKLYAREVMVHLDSWSDYVFEPDYKLMPLNVLGKYIAKNKHLPDVPSEKEVKKNGISLGEMDALLLKKIEEITLYVIDLKKENDKLKESNGRLTKQVELLKNQVQ